MNKEGKGIHRTVDIKEYIYVYVLADLKILVDITTYGVELSHITNDTDTNETLTKEVPETVNHLRDRSESIYFIISTYIRSPMAEDIQTEITEIKHQFER
jgi:hypothetical protein